MSFAGLRLAAASGVGRHAGGGKVRRQIVCPDKASAAKGSAHDAYALALAYDKGSCDIAADPQKALTWYRRAAQQGSMLAAFAMGEIYFTGSNGVAPDYPKAKKWYLVAAEKGYGPAQLRLGFLCAEHYYDGLQPDFAAAEKWFLAAAKQNTGDAQFRLGTFYHFYKRPPELKKAVYWLTRAAKGGNRLAMFDLSRMIENGEGTKKDPQKALTWLTKSAGLGMPAAEMQLSDMYANGTGGVKKDMMESFIWTMKVAKEPSAIPYWIDKAADIVFSGAPTIEKNYPLAFQLYGRAAAHGDAHAEARLGEMYLKGLGTKADPVQARRYFEQAAAAGDAEAKAFLARKKGGGKK
ncbi:MAG: SEL1-like repeat protein [Alphaproteobacteria bacterium]|nr:SEL1-like repeat protein [Alphaproteobacteria bacterium]